MVAMVRMEVSSVMSLAIGSIMRISQTRISNFLKVANIHSSNTYCRVKLLSFGSHEVIVRQRLMNNRWVVLCPTSKQSHSILIMFWLKDLKVSWDVWKCEYDQRVSDELTTPGSMSCWLQPAAKMDGRLLFMLVIMIIIITDISGVFMLFIYFLGFVKNLMAPAAALMDPKNGVYNYGAMSPVQDDNKMTRNLSASGNTPNGIWTYWLCICLFH